MPSGLWAPRSIDETMKLYAGWAATYEADVGAAGYATPARIAAALAAHLRDPAAPILDFGCGTGLSGVALAAEGFEVIDGTDISPEMLARSAEKGIYRTLMPGQPDHLPDATPYAAVTACGVISLGAAPADTLAGLLSRMRSGTLLAFSFNDATLVSPPYMTALAEVQTAGLARLLWAQYGPHLPEKEGARGSTVHILQRP